MANRTIFADMRIFPRYPQKWTTDYAFAYRRRSHRTITAAPVARTLGATRPDVDVAHVLSNRLIE